jgi:hypothetical protein
VNRIQVVEKLLPTDQDLLQNLRRQYLTLKENENLAHKVLKDIVVSRSNEGLEIRYVFEEP